MWTTAVPLMMVFTIAMMFTSVNGMSVGLPGPLPLRPSALPCYNPPERR